MAKQKPTKKDIESVMYHMINHLKFIEGKLNGLDGLFGLYLDWKKDKDKFNKFVENTIKKYNEKENEPGETK